MQTSEIDDNLSEVSIQPGLRPGNATDDGSSVLGSGSRMDCSAALSPITIMGSHHIGTDDPNTAPSEPMLSSEDMSELTTFAQKKQDVEQQIAIIRAWPHLDPFKNIGSYEADADVLEHHRANLAKLTSELRHDQQERDRLDSQVQQFNVHDMNRLRSVAKETSKRHLSGSDTDLIELALETVYALDKLLRLLRARKVEQDLAELRLKWETMICSSWEDLVMIQKDLSAFKTRCESSPHDDPRQDRPSRASKLSSEEVYQSQQKGQGIRLQSGKEQRRRAFSSKRIASEAIKLESSRLILRIKSLNTDKVLPAGRILDALIDQRQVPVKMIDEQEKLEESMPPACKIEEKAARLTSAAQNGERAVNEQYNDIDDAASSLRELSVASDANSAMPCSPEHSRSSLSSCATSNETSKSDSETSNARWLRTHSSEIAKSVSPVKDINLKVAKSSRTLTPSRPVGKRPNQYRANPKSQIDVAVGHVVNKMPISVTILPARLADVPLDARAKDHTDLSGRYWVGDPDPRLCFCRILRSNMVMVRVGGGWQELSQFIYQHYYHLRTSEEGSPLDLSQSTQLHASTPPKSQWMRSASGPADPTVLRHNRRKPGSRDQKGDSASPETPRNRVVTMPISGRQSEIGTRSRSRKHPLITHHAQARLDSPSVKPSWARRSTPELPRSDSGSSVIIRSGSPS